MRQVTSDHLTAILGDHEPPCISLYQPTHRRHPENQQDPIRYRNLVQRVETSLREKYPTRDVRGLLEQLSLLSRDETFWAHRTEGLAVLCTTTKFQLFELQLPVPEVAIVADSFHTKPLLRILQSADRYQVLCIDRVEARLYEGNRDALDLVELDERVPSTIEEALGGELTEPHITVASYGGIGGVAMRHGQGQKKDEVKGDSERFFRAVDRAVLDHHSRPSGLPLFLAALPEHQGMFRKISRNSQLAAEGIAIDPNSLSVDQLREHAWRVEEPYYLNRLANLVAAFEEAQAKQLGSAILSDIAQALVAGRVGTLLVEADRKLPGKFDARTGRIEFSQLDSPEVDDLLDDLAEHTLRSGGEVVVVPAQRMPTDSGAAATYRF